MYLLVLLVFIQHSLALLNVRLESETLECSNDVFGRDGLLGRGLARFVRLRRYQMNKLWSENKQVACQQEIWRRGGTRFGETRTDTTRRDQVSGVLRADDVLGQQICKSSEMDLVSHAKESRVKRVGGGTHLR